MKPPVIGKRYKVYEWDGTGNKKRGKYLGAWIVTKVEELVVRGKDARWWCSTKAGSWSICPKDITKR